MPSGFEKGRRYDLFVPVCIHVGRGKNFCSVKVEAGYENMFFSIKERTQQVTCMLGQISYIRGEKI